MALLDRVKERTGTDLSNGELTAMIDAITEELNFRFGTAGEITVDLGDFVDPHSAMLRTLRLIRPADPGLPIVVVEIDPGNSGAPEAERVLDPADFDLVHGGRTLRRLASGPNAASYWAPMVRVTYTPTGEAAAREEATIKLVQLALSYRGSLVNERAGDYEFTLDPDHARQREAIFAALAQRQSMVMA